MVLGSEIEQIFTPSFRLNLYLYQPHTINYITILFDTNLETLIKFPEFKKKKKTNITRL